jgi:hypothetical protein
MLGKLVKFGVAGALGSTALVMTLGATAFAAGNGYAPPSQATGTAPGGYTQVVLNQSVPSGGGTLVASYGQSSYSANVPAADAGQGVTLAITAPSNLSSADNAIFGFGVALAHDGVGVSGTFASPLVITIKNPTIKAGDLLEEWNGTAWVVYNNATVRAGSVTVTVTSDPQFALVSAPVSPAPATTTPIPNSTSPHTGVPITGIWVLASIGILGGSLAATRAIRVRHHSA